MLGERVSKDPLYKYVYLNIRVECVRMPSPLSKYVYLNIHTSREGLKGPSLQDSTSMYICIYTLAERVSKDPLYAYVYLNILVKRVSKDLSMSMCDRHPGAIMRAFACLNLHAFLVL